jgi:hypothetical protein
VLDLSGTRLTGSVANWDGSDLISLEELRVLHSSTFLGSLLFYCCFFFYISGSRTIQMILNGVCSVHGNKCEIHLLDLVHENGYGSYLDNNRINIGTLKLLELLNFEQ